MTGEDIVLSPAAKKIIPYSFECKNVEKLNIWNALEQAETNCDGRTPVVVFKRNRSKTYVAIEYKEWLKTIKQEVLIDKTTTGWGNNRVSIDC